MNVAERLFRELAEQWDGPPLPPLRIIGSTALMLQTDWERGTKDSDLLETLELDEQIKSRLLELAGPDSTLARRWRMYLDVVSNGVPFLPQVPNWHAIDLEVELDLHVLDVVDVVVSKLKRFSAADVGDIDAMVQKGLVPHHLLIQRFEDAADFWSTDARARDLGRYVSHLNTVERDMLLVEPTLIDLPSWV